MKLEEEEQEIGRELEKNNGGKEETENEGEEDSYGAFLKEDNLSKECCRHRFDIVVVNVNDYAETGQHLLTRSVSCLTQ